MNGSQKEEQKLNYAPWGKPDAPRHERSIPDDYARAVGCTASAYDAISNGGRIRARVALINTIVHEIKAEIAAAVDQVKDPDALADILQYVNDTLEGGKNGAR